MNIMYQLPKLNYAYDALEPYIDAKTMELHHTKHHQTYVDKLNAALDKYPDLQEKTVEDLLMSFDSLQVADADKTASRNHGGGHANLSLFWQILDPSNQKDEQLISDITATFGSIDDFKKQFTDSATKLFGSGWTWLLKNADGKFEIKNLPMQDSPFMLGFQPVFGLDLWEHAYYLKYQNRRPEYIENFWQALKLI